ncbi:MAG: TetR/AcrR family transcriptional regulator [Alphaproteobacteria bacterium]
MPSPAPAVQIVTEDGYRLDTRSRILQAALDVFAARGYDAATIREITNRVGVSHGLIKYHFENKDTLWREAIRFMFDRVRPAMRLTEEEAATLNPRQQFEAEIRKGVTYYARHPEHLRILTYETMNDSGRLKWITENFLDELMKEALARIREHIAAGVLPDLDPLHLYYATSGAIQTMFATAPEIQRARGMDYSSSANIDQHVETILTLFLGPPTEDAT